VSDLIPSAVITCEPGWEAPLVDELGQVFPASRHATIAPGWVESHLSSNEAIDRPIVAFASQCLPVAEPIEAPSISAWARQAATWLIERLQGHDAAWRLHVFTVSGPEGAVTSRRCHLIREEILAILKKKQRRLLRTLAADDQTPWSEDEAFVQIGLTTATSGYLSYAPPTIRQTFDLCLSRFPGGVVDVPSNRQAPSRAFQKLAEVEIRLGRQIAKNESCVDLGSSPGSWAWLALSRGAKVVAVDRSPLRADLMDHPRLTFVRGDAFRYEPDAPVDWLLSDVIAFPLRSVELLEQWLGNGWCRHFCVTIKFRGTDDYPKLAEIKSRLLATGADFYLRRLTHNKNEITAFGNS